MLLGSDGDEVDLTHRGLVRHRGPRQIVTVRSVASIFGVIAAAVGVAYVVTGKNPSDLLRLQPDIEPEMLAIENGLCKGFPIIRFTEVLHNNLGNMGPMKGQEGIYYAAVDMKDMQRKPITLEIHNYTKYFPFSPKMNGMDGKFGTINLKPGTEVGLTFKISDANTKKPLKASEAAFSFFDLDTGPKDKWGHLTTVESVSASGFQKPIMTKSTEIKVSKFGSWTSYWQSMTTFTASTFGTGADNPTDPDALEERQRNRAVSLLFKDFSEFKAIFKATPGQSPRFFTFVGENAVDCAKVKTTTITTTTTTTFSKLAPLHIGPEETPVKATEKCIFNTWVKKKGDTVKKGDPIATALVNGKGSNILAPVDGTVVNVQPLVKGDPIKGRVADLNIATIGPLRLHKLDEDPGDIPVDVDPGCTFKSWKAKVGDNVKKGDPIALVVGPDGKEITVPALGDGIIKCTQPLKENQHLDAILPDKSIAIISPVMLSPLQVESGVSSIKVPAKSVFMGWKVKEGDTVKVGDPVAVVLVNGKNQTLTASMDGVVNATQPLIPGNFISGRVKDMNILTICPPPLPQLIINDTQIGVPLPEGNTFLEYKVQKGAYVKKGDPIATVLVNGQNHTIPALSDGLVEALQPLKPGERSGLRLKGPRYFARIRKPSFPLEITDDDTPVSAPNGTYFVNFLVQRGDDVNSGDGVATVEKRTQFSKKSITLKAPKSGVVKSRAGLQPGDNIDVMAPDHNIVVVGTTPSSMPWWMWLLLFLLCLCCLLLILLVLLCPRDKDKRTYSPLPTPPPPPIVEEPPKKAPVVAPVPTPSPVAAPVVVPPAAPVPAPKGVKIEFDDKGTTRAFTLDYRPLGAVIHEEAPIRVDYTKFNSYAKHLQIQPGWIIKKIGDSDVSHNTHFKEVYDMLERQLKPNKIWPLRIDFRAGTELKTLTLEKHPLGFEYHNRIPICVKHVHPKSYAQHLGIKEGWTIERIGDVDVTGSRHTLEDQQKMLLDGTDCLDKYIPA